MNDFFAPMIGQEENDSCFPSLTLKERLIGFGICVGLGFLLQFLSMGALIGLFLGKTSKFAFLYTAGNIISIMGTLFLVGPVRQFKNMIDSNRKWTTIVFIGSIVMTLLSVYCFKSKILTIIFIIIQLCAYIWYVLSYIPYGRDICKKCLKGFASTATTNA